MRNLVSDIFVVPSATAHSMNHVGSISVLHTMIGDYFPTWFLHHSSLPCDYLCRAALGSGRKVEPLTPPLNLLQVTAAWPSDPDPSDRSRTNYWVFHRLGKSSLRTWLPHCRGDQIRNGR